MNYIKMPDVRCLNYFRRTLILKGGKNIGERDDTWN